MNKKEYEYLEQCFDQLLHDYNCAQIEIKQLKDTIDILKALCTNNNIEVPSLEEPIPF